MDIQQINSAIMFGDWSNDQLNSMIAAIKFNKSHLIKRVKFSIMPGDTVEWVSGKTGRTVSGVVTKVAIKYVSVRTPEGIWKVPANMLKTREVA